MESGDLSMSASELLKIVKIQFTLWLYYEKVSVKTHKPFTARKIYETIPQHNMGLQRAPSTAALCSFGTATEDRDAELQTFVLSCK